MLLEGSVTKEALTLPIISAYRFMHKYKDLGTFLLKVNSENDWINYISKGRLISPSHLYEVDLIYMISFIRKRISSFRYFIESFFRKDPSSKQ